jgi:hypothetical protein
MRTSITNAVIALIICTAAIAGYGIWYAAVEAKSAAVANLQSRIDALTETSARISSARAALSQLSGDEAAVQGYFVPETGIVAFIEDLEGRGRLLGAAVSVLSVSKGSAGGRPALAFSISIKGTFDAVMRTVGAIEYAPYALSLSSLALAQNDKNAWQADAKFSVGSVPASAAATTTTSKP